MPAIPEPNNHRELGARIQRRGPCADAAMQISAPSSNSSPSSASGARLWVLHGLALGAATAAGAAAYLYRWPSGFRSRAVGIIPARFASTRFEGKPLIHILGKPMIQRTWERVMLASSLDHVVVATDDERIAECCRGFGADVIMTSESCKNGSERCCEALNKLEKHYDIVVNIQGDEPLIEPEIIDGVVMSLQRAPDAVFSTAVTSLKPEDAFYTNRVKCVVDNQGYAIYFSRGLIPFNKSGNVNPKYPYLLHLGIAGFDSKFLKIYPELPPTPLQMEEDLEQLKVLENGYRMNVFWHVIKVDHDAHGVDAPEDVEKNRSTDAGKKLSAENEEKVSALHCYRHRVGVRLLVVLSHFLNSMIPSKAATSVLEVCAC